MRSFLTATTLAWALLALAGCGKPLPPWGKVSGLVTQTGKPVASALVLFSNREAGVEWTTETDASGRFTMRTDKIDGLPVGTYKVTVMPKPNLPTLEQGMMVKEAVSPAKSSIPNADRELATTRLSATVQEGANDFTFDLQP